MSYNKFLTLLLFLRKGGLKGFLNFVLMKNKTFYRPPLTFPIFGLLRHKEEILNIRDNIFQGSIRYSEIEKKLRKASRPVIVDCGINVGVTVRWWFYLNPKSIVYGIDMMQEAQDFTITALSECARKNYIPITAALASTNNKALEIKYDDPLFGGNSVEVSKKYMRNKRHILSSTLDDCLRKYNIKDIDLLKIDIEFSAAPMLCGASETLKKTKYVLLEWHDAEERKNSVICMQKAGFIIKKECKRNIWFKNF